MQALTALSQTFGELSEKLCSVLPKVKRLYFVTDTYKDNSIKSADTRRGKTLIKHPVFVDVFGTLGETDSVPEGSQTELEEFVCYMYGKTSYKHVCLRMPLTLTVTTMRRLYVWPAYWTSSMMTEMMILKTTQLH